MLQRNVDKPRIVLPADAFDTALELAGAVLLAGFLLLVAASWSSLPDQLPTHFNFAGEPDRWAGRGQILILPLIATAQFILLTVLARFPHRHNYIVTITAQNAERQYRLVRRLMHALKLLLVLLFMTIYLGAWGVAAGRLDGLPGAVVWGPLAAIFALIGWHLLQSRRAR